MNKHKFFLLVGIFSLLALFSLAFVKVVFLQSSVNNKSRNGFSKLCSSIVGGLKFCTDEQKISIPPGEMVVLHFTLKNTSEKQILVKTNKDLSKYNIRVKNEKGENILTKLEQKMEADAMTYDDQKDFVNSLFRNHQSEELKPNQVFNEKIVLSEIYDLTNVGKYFVEVARKTRNPNGDGFIEIPLDRIEVEVK